MTTTDVGDGGTIGLGFPEVPADPGGFVVLDIILNTPSHASASGESLHCFTSMPQLSSCGRITPFSCEFHARPCALPVIVLPEVLGLN